jgi:hypothetical protein
MGQTTPGGKNVSREGQGAMLNFEFSILNCGTSSIKDRTTIQHSKFNIQNYPLPLAFP